MRRNLAIAAIFLPLAYSLAAASDGVPEQVKKLRTAGKFRTALHIIEKIQNPSPRTLWFRGKLHLDIGRPALAVEDLSKVCPDLQMWNCYNDWGTALLLMNKPVQARKVFEKAYYKVNANARLASNLALAWSLSGNDAKAEMVHKEAVSGAHGRKDGIALINYAAFLVERERYIDAKPLLDDAGKYPSVKEHFFRWLTLGKWHSRQGYYSEALQCFNKGLREHPTYFELYFERAKVFQVFGNAPMALADLRKADSVWPSNDRTEELRAQIRKSLKRPVPNEG